MAQATLPGLPGVLRPVFAPPATVVPTRLTPHCESAPARIESGLPRRSARGSLTRKNPYSWYVPGGEMVQPEFGETPLAAHRGPGFQRPGDVIAMLALGVHGLAGRAAEQIIWDQVGESVRWVRRSRKFTAYVPSNSPFPKPDQEPYINSPVPEAIPGSRTLASRG